MNVIKMPSDFNACEAYDEWKNHKFKFINGMLDFVFDKFELKYDQTYRVNLKPRNQKAYIEIQALGKYPPIMLRIGEDIGDFKRKYSVDNYRGFNFEKRKDDVAFGIFAFSYDYLSYWEERFISPFGFDSYEDIIMDFVTVLLCMNYIISESRSRDRVIKKTGKTHKYSREYRLSTNGNKVFLFDDIVNYIHDNYVGPKKTHDIQCQCWDVRGHYRHYKSGKVIFIKNYRKGKQRDMVEPIRKEYIAK